ncbi:MAG: GNAT family N-acetyltransferase [Clostridia bacterium]|nr:GNAT family N-acetyltransferase [Clostridia bacterium]
MIRYRLSQSSDMEGLIDHINMIFSMLRTPHNFEEMLPKVYGKEHRIDDMHVIAEEEDGRIGGCLGMYVFPLRVCDTVLRVGYLGSMAVHPRVRGQGTMGTLMRKQIERGYELGLDLMVLGGQRQRYQRSGFETGGAGYVYSISRANVRHALADTDAGDISFRTMAQEDVPAMLCLYDRQVVAGARREDNFIATLKSYRRDAWMILRADKPVGYISATADGQTIGEIVLEEAALILPAIKAWVEQRQVKNLHLSAAPYDSVLGGLLAPICESFSLNPSIMLRVLKPETVLPAYMKLQNTMHPLSDGRVVLGWEGNGAYEFRVSGGEITVRKTEEAPHDTLSQIDFHQLIFGYNRFAAPKIQAEIPENWFPLPVYIPEPDSF